MTESKKWKNGKHMTVRDIYSKKDRANYIASIPIEDRPDLSKKVKRWVLSPEPEKVESK